MYAYEFSCMTVQYIRCLCQYSQAGMRCLLWKSLQVVYKAINSTHAHPSVTFVCMWATRWVSKPGRVQAWNRASADSSWHHTLKIHLNNPLWLMEWKQEVTLSVEDWRWCVSNALFLVQVHFSYVKCFRQVIYKIQKYIAATQERKFSLESCYYEKSISFSWFKPSIKENLTTCQNLAIRLIIV